MVLSIMYHLKGTIGQWVVKLSKTADLNQGFVLQLASFREMFVVAC